MTARCAFLSAALAALAATAAAAVPGRVVSAEGKPVAGAAVSAYAPETTEARRSRLVAGQERRALATAKSGADGSFRLEAGDPVVVVGVRADGFAPSMTTTTSGPGDHLTVKLAPAATRKGTVTAGGRPVAGAYRLDKNAEDPRREIVRTAKDGAYEVRPDRGSSGRRSFIQLRCSGHADEVARATSWPSASRSRTVTEEDRPRRAARRWLDGWPRAVSATDGRSRSPTRLRREAPRRMPKPGGRARRGRRPIDRDRAAGALPAGDPRDAHQEPLVGALVFVADAHHETVPT